MTSLACPGCSHPNPVPTRYAVSKLAEEYGLCAEIKIKLSCAGCGRSLFMRYETGNGQKPVDNPNGLGV